MSGGIVLALVVRASRWANKFAPAGPQRFHVAAARSLVGVSVFGGFVSAIAIALHLEYVPLRPVVPLLIAALPVLLVGLWEDITHRVPPKYRLLAAVFSAALASAFAQGVLPRLDLPFVDSWLDYLPIAVPLTCFMVAGASNAFNIIDGTNGLAGGSALLMFAGLAAIAAVVGDTLV